MKYAKGIMWLDDCRIPFVDDGDIKSQQRAFTDGSSSHKGQAWNNHLGWEGSKGGANPTNQQGRFTPNLLVCDDMLNDGVISKSGGRTISKTEDTNIKNNVYNVGWIRTGSDVKDKGSNSRFYDLDKWFDKIVDNL